jgi:Spy/CpxP family protein refolding chaperone
MKKILTLIALFLMTWMFAPNVEAFDIHRWSRKLKLTEQQENQIKAIILKQRREQIQLRAQLQLARIDMRELLDQHRPDVGKVLQAVENVGKFELALKKSRILMVVQIKAIFTPEQNAQANKMRMEHGKRRAWQRRRHLKDRPYTRERHRKMRVRPRDMPSDDAPPPPVDTPVPPPRP